MKQGILITAYKNIEQLSDLLDAFDDNFVFYIHIDKKSEIPQIEIDKLKSKKGVLLVSQAYDIKWGGINHLKAILLLLEVGLKNAEITYFHLITGQDYPIKKSAEIISFMNENSGKEFMEYNSLPYKDWPRGGMNRLEHYNLNDVFNGREGIGRSIIMKLLAVQRILGFKRKFPASFPKDLYGGSTYWTLSKSCIEYVFKYLKSHPEYLKRFDYSFCSEEIFFQTIILNSPFKDKVVNNCLRYIVWEVRNNSFPANLDSSDLESILSSDALFARKIEHPHSDKLLKEVKSMRDN